MTRKKGGFLIMKPVKIKCPYCGCPAILRPASYVHGDRAKEKYLYVCAGYPKCDAYVSIHRGTLIPKGTLAKGDLRHSRIEAHKAMALLWEHHIMTRTQAYQWIRYRFGLRSKHAHIGQFSEYMCSQLIAECHDILKNHHIIDS